MGMESADLYYLRYGYWEDTKSVGQSARSYEFWKFRLLYGVDVDDGY